MFIPVDYDALELRIISEMAHREGITVEEFLAGGWL